MKIVFNGYINAELKNSEEKKNLLNTITNLIPLFFSKALYYYVYNNFSKIFRKYKSIENKEILFNKFCHIFDLWKLLYDIKDDDKMNSNYITFIGRSVLNLVNKNSAQNQFKEVDIYIEFEDGINLLNEKNNDFLLVNVFYTDYIQQNLRIEGIINDKDKEKINNIFIKIDNTSMNCVLDGDFEFACKDAKKGDFIFLDSPYAPLNPTSFESYTKEGFDIESHKRLAKLYDELTDRGCYCMLTNHNTDLINELYGNKGYKIDVVSVKRMINSDASNRVGEEVIICNY